MVSNTLRLFHTATDEEIKEGRVTDVYFERTEKILRAKGKDKVRVAAEITVSSMPSGKEWGVLTGVVEAAKLLSGLDVDFYSMPEGNIFYARDRYGVKEPVAFVEGPYVEFCKLETPLLGLLCQASGISTKAAHIRLKVWDKVLLSFGARRMHPAISPMIDWSCYVGGFDAVSTLRGAELIGERPVGTMPHALVIVLGDQRAAWLAFDEVVEEEVPRIALVDTFYDEKVEALMAAETLGKRLYGVRLDTPSSRRGNMADIIREVRWELDLRGYRHVKIIVSGGIDEHNVEEFARAGADGFGIGTAVSNAPTIDFALDIVEVEGRPIAKRGKLAGKKQVWRCPSCLRDIVKPFGEGAPSCPDCGERMAAQLIKLVDRGRIAKLPTAKEAREHVMKQLAALGGKPWGSSLKR